MASAVLRQLLRRRAGELVLGEELGGAASVAPERGAGGCGGAGVRGCGAAGVRGGRKPKGKVFASFVLFLGGWGGFEGLSV